MGEKKVGELWSTNKKVIGTHLDPPKWNFSGDCISALRGFWSLKFLHALEIDQGLLAHTHNGNGGAPKKFKGEHVKLGLKFSVSAYNFAASGSNVTKLYRATCRDAGVFKWTQCLGKARPLNLVGQN